jgi:hypothetical protein
MLNNHCHRVTAQLQLNNNNNNNNNNNYNYYYIFVPKLSISYRASSDRLQGTRGVYRGLTGALCQSVLLTATNDLEI